MRKRQYDFTKAKEANRKAQSEVAKNADKAKNSEKTTGAPDGTITSTTASDTQANTVTGTPTTDIVADTSISPSTNDIKSQDQILSDNKNAETTLQSSPEDSMTSVENGETKCDTEVIIKNREKTACEGNGETHHLGPASEDDLVKPTVGERRKKTVRISLSTPFP